MRATGSWAYLTRGLDAIRADDERSGRGHRVDRRARAVGRGCRAHLVKEVYRDREDAGRQIQPPKHVTRGVLARQGELVADEVRRVFRVAEPGNPLPPGVIGQAGEGEPVAQAI